MISRRIAYYLTLACAATLVTPDTVCARVSTSVTCTVSGSTTGQTSRLEGVANVCERQDITGKASAQAVAFHGALKAISVSGTENVNGPVTSSYAAASVSDVLNLQDGFIAGATYSSGIRLQIDGLMGTGVGPNYLGYTSDARTDMTFVVTLANATSGAVESQFRASFSARYVFQPVVPDIADIRNYTLTTDGSVRINDQNFAFPGGLATAPNLYDVPITLTGGQAYSLYMAVVVNSRASNYEALAVSDASNSFYWGGLAPLVDASGQFSIGRITATSGTDWHASYAPSPVSEPSSALMLLFGAAFILGRAKKSSFSKLGEA